jgi:hypothetical protein
MLSSVIGSQSSSALAGLTPQQTTPSGSTASFTDQLAAALEGYLAQSGNSSNLEIDIQTTQSQNSGVRQFIVTVTNPDSTSGQTGTPASDTSATATAPDTTTAPAFMTASGTATAAAPANTPVTTNTPPPSATSTDPEIAEIDAYWAAQPPAVQQLRNVADFAARNALAQQLSDEGYSIDRAIMVWGWDPMKTMATRQMYGYTWVPSYNQSSISAAPGMAQPGETPYDPGNPPPGSIAVNMDFAKGLNITDPLNVT